MPPGPTSGTSPLSIRLAVAVAILAFVGLGCLWMDRPGLQYDEALFVSATYPNPQRGGAGYIEPFGRPICIMVMPYLGALKGWLYRLVFEVAPLSAAAVRAPVVFLGAATLLMLFHLSRRIFDAPTGLLAVTLAATDPVFLFTTRLDWGPVAIQRLCWLSGCVLLMRWREAPKALWLFAASLVFGLGLFDKLTFAWILAALIAAGLIVVPKELNAHLRLRPVLIALAGFLLGCLPLLIYRLTTSPPSLGLRSETSLMPYLAKLSMLQHCFDGTIFQGWLAEVSAPQAALPGDGLAGWVSSFAGETLIDATWFPWALGAAVLFLPWTLRTPARRGLLFVFLFSTVAVAVMIPVEFAGYVHHLALIYPLPQLFVAASLMAGAGRLAHSSKHWLRKGLLFGAAGVLVLTNLRAVAQQYGQILQFGGTPAWSEGIYALHDSLEAGAHRQIIVLDWGLAMPLRLLSKDRLPLKEAPQPGAEERYFMDTIQQSLAEPGAVFAGYDPSVASVNPRTRELLEQAVREAGRRLRRIQTVRDLQGRSRFEILGTEQGDSPAEED
jgi:4-amino-4-deoxy-L-arabinose transferase-like glycosyltransferase